MLKGSDTRHPSKEIWRPQWWSGVVKFTARFDNRHTADIVRRRSQIFRLKYQLVEKNYDDKVKKEEGNQQLR